MERARSDSSSQPFPIRVRGRSELVGETVGQSVHGRERPLRRRRFGGRRRCHVDDMRLHPSGPASEPNPAAVVLSRAVGCCSNYNSVGENAARDTLKHVISEALEKSGSSQSSVRAVCLGVSGVNHAKDQQMILNWLREIFPSHAKVYIQNDAIAALASGTMGKPHGCVLVAGTGCIAHGVSTDGKEARAAGAGPILGDWGSGYGIAAQALTAVIRAHDG